jgi:putative ABC transport system permease protein
MLIKIAWRNIWRSPKRSIVLILSIVMGIWAGAFIMAFYWGMTKNQVEESIRQNLSHIQLHHPDFKNDYDPSFHITDYADLQADLVADTRVKAYSARAMSIAMAASANKSTGVTIFGIDPAREEQVTGLKDKLIAGDYFEPGKQNQVIIGNKLAEELKVDLRKKIICTFQDTEGNITSVAARVAGIYKTRNARLEEGYMYMLREDLTRLQGNTSLVHEVAVLLENDEDVDAVATGLKAGFPGLDTQDWKDLSPELRMMSESFNQYMYIIIGIILLALLFGIINTMLMAVLERVRELGVLMSVGLNKTKVFLMIMLETVFISLIGGPLGLFLAWVTVQLTNKNGIDLRAFAEGLEQFGYSNMVYPELAFNSYIDILIMVVVAALIASVFPAMRALRLKPVEAIRKI